MVDPNISLMQTPIDTGTAVNNYQNQARQNAIATQNVLRQQLENMDLREQSRLRSSIAGASQLKVFLDAGDMQGAQNFLLNRKNTLMQRAGAGEAIDTQETDEALRLLQSGNIEELQNGVNGLLTAGQVYGMVNAPGADGGATGVMVQRLIDEGSASNAQEALQILKGGAGAAGRLGAEINLGRQANFEQQTGTNLSDLQFKPQIAGAEATARLEAEKQSLQPKAQAALQASLTAKSNVLGKIREAIPKVDAFTAGFFGPTFSIIPGTPAADLRADLDTIRANVGFDKLQEMRDNSPTGGALGQVTERELELLQATWSNVTQAQSPEQLRARLEELERQVQQSWDNVQRAYELDFGNIGQQGAGNGGARIVVTNGRETFEIDAVDLPAAQADGFRQQ